MIAMGSKASSEKVGLKSEPLDFMKWAFQVNLLGAAHANQSVNPLKKKSSSISETGRSNRIQGTEKEKKRKEKSTRTLPIHSKRNGGQIVRSRKIYCISAQKWIITDGVAKQIKMS